MEVLIVFVVLCFAGGVLYRWSGGAGAAAARLSPLPVPPSPAPSTTPALPRRSLEDVETFHANELNVVSVSIVELQPEILRSVSFYRLGQAMAEKLGTLDRRAADDDYVLKTAGTVQREYLAERASQALRNAVFQRTLRDLSEAERATLRLSDLLTAVGAMDTRERLQILTPIVWNEGRSLLAPSGALGAADMLQELRRQLTVLIEGHLGPSSASIERLQHRLREVLNTPGTLTRSERGVLERMLYQGARWMSEDAAATAMVPRLPPRPSVLRLGRLDGTQEELLYDRNESLITLAPPGQGKSQSVLRNLLTMDGGAVVIDIKGELYEQTALWRARNVGPVYRLAPSDPANSISFNPLDAIRPEVEDAYEDARKLVDLLIVPADLQKKDYWDKRGLDVLADAILDTALHEEPGDNGARSLEAVFDRLYLEPLAPSVDGSGHSVDTFQGSELEAWTIHLKNTKVSKLVRLGKSLPSMPPKVRESVIETARTNIEVW
uniref:type IV secretory system conjugative DNA transfer family protein n=1 Tax=Rhizobium rhizoryzae TaxID=451876 RepID=UPI0028B25211